MIILAFSFGLTKDWSKQEVEARDGILDLSKWSRSKNISLSGQWDFYWGSLMKPEDFAANPKPDIKATVPAFWNSYKLRDQNLPGFGYGTYRLQVTGVTAGEPFAITIAIPTSAYKMFIDGELRATAGRVGASREEHQPEFISRTFELKPQSESFDIVVQVSNYTAARGGLAYRIYLGHPDKIHSMNDFNKYTDVLMLGSFLMLLMFFFTIYYLRPIERANLYFALLCIFALIRTSFYGEYSLTSSLLVFSYEVNVLVVFITLYGIPAILALFVKELFPKETSHRIVIAVIIYAGCVSVFSLLSPVYYYTKFTLLYELVASLIVIYLASCVSKAWWRGNKDAPFILAGILIMLFSGLLDMVDKSPLVSSDLLGNFDFLPIGFYGLVLLNCFVLTRRYVDSFTKIEQLNAELIEADKLKDKILQTEMAFLQSQIKPHFLYNALSAISVVCAKDALKAERLIIDLAFFLRASLDWNSKDEMTTLERELDFVDNYIHIEQARFGDKIRLTTEIHTDKVIMLPKLILQPIVENAVRHGISKKKTGGEIIIVVSGTQAGTSFEILDTGVGISKDKLSNLLNEEVASQSVGLKNINSRLIKRYGSGLVIESEENVMTVVSFVIK